ncbi:MAG TPA: hypothetical protein VK420_00235, partial [Longimicrobium sp.]|nr:hypothetical protein [Longimicrobium sp.]
GLRVLCCAFAPLRPTPDAARVLGLSSERRRLPEALGRAYSQVLDALGGILRAAADTSLEPGTASPLTAFPQVLAGILNLLGRPDRVEAVLLDFLRGLEQAPSAEPVPLRSRAA